VLLAAVLAAYVGSQQRRLPPAFGPAANGQLVFSQDGDIYTADPKTGASKAIVTSPERETQPVYSLDGTRLAFGRGGLLFVTDASGGGLTQVTPEPLLGLNSWGFSPDGKSIVAFASGDQGPVIVIIPSDGKSDPKLFPVIASCSAGCDGPPSYRPDGSEIMFIGKDPAQAYRGVYALDPATGVVRTIVAPSTSHLDIHGASWSPDGTYVAYGMYDDSVEAISTKTHVVRVDGTGDVVVDTDPASIADAGLAWSNDSTRLIVSRFYAPDQRRVRSVIVPIDHSSASIEIACPPKVNGDDCTADWMFSPDDSLLLGTIENPGGSTSQFLADPRTGEIRPAPWTASGHPSWQRLAR
jgi:Tol biopolymer transport system component